MFTEYSTDQILETLSLDNDHCDDFFESLAEARQALQGFDIEEVLSPLGGNRDYLGNLEESYV